MKNCVINETAYFGENTQIGEFCVIENNVIIGKNCVVGHHVVIREGSVIGDNTRIDDGAVIGKLPMRAANSAALKASGLPPCQIGNDCIIGTGAVIYRGAIFGEKVMSADYSTVRENVTIGDKTIIGRGAAIENQCEVGERCKIETNAYITAYSVIEDDCFIAPCVVTSNDNFAARSKERYGHFKGVTVRKGGRIGAGAVILPGKTIGADGFAAAGSVVTRDIPDRQIAAGTPAKVIREVPSEQLLENQ